MQPSGMGVAAYKNDSIPYTEYKIKQGNRLYIRVYSLDEQMNTLYNGMMGMANLSGGISTELYTYLVYPDGNIILPNVGEFHVEGKTTREVKYLLEEELKPYFRLGQVDVDVQVVGRYYSVIGEAGNGRFLISRDKINIFQALALAGDIGIYGDRSKIRIIRETEEGTKIINFDVRSADIINSEYYYIEANDVIYIQTVKEQFFSLLSLPAVLGTIISTFSFGVLLYNIIKKE